jgi:hypothetical protein
MKGQSVRRLKLSLSLSLSLLSACAAVPPDVPVFENLAQHLGTDALTGHMILKPSPVCAKAIGEPECGHGVQIVSGRQFFVGEKKEHWFNGKPWSQLKRESVYVPAEESYAPLATYIINSCAQARCNDQVSRFKVRLDELRGVGAVIGGVK